MLLNEVLEKQIKNGSYARLVRLTYPPTKSVYKGRVSKITDGVVRLGVNYSNLKINEDKETGPLNYGHWHKDNLIIEQEKDGKITYQLRFYTTGNPNHIQKSQWFLDGTPITKGELIEMGVFTGGQLKTMANPNSNPTGTYNIKLENVISIN